MDGQTDGGDYNIPFAFLIKRGDNKPNQWSIRNIHAYGDFEGKTECCFYGSVSDSYQFVTDLLNGVHSIYRI